MGSVVLAGATSGSTTITPTDAVTATVTLPSTGGTLQTSGAGFTTNGVAYASSTSALTTGSALTFNGTNLGIGTSSPSAILTVSGSNTAARGQLSVIGASTDDPRVTLYRNGTFSGAISCTSTVMYIDAVEAVPMAFYTSDTERMRITSSGTLVLNPGSTSSPLPALDIHGGSGTGTLGAIRIGDGAYPSNGNYWNIGRDNNITGNFTFSYNGTQNSYIQANTGTYVAVSDSRVKKNIVDSNYGLAEILRLRPVMYNMILEEENVKQHIGFIAQEVKAVIDESVDDLIDESLQFYGLDKSGLVPVLVKAIQELSTLITAQQSTIQSLTERITALEGART